MCACADATALICTRLGGFVGSVELGQHGRDEGLRVHPVESESGTAAAANGWRGLGQVDVRHNPCSRRLTENHRRRDARRG